MRENKPTKQHYVPQCYLREFADPAARANRDPFVWIFDKDGKNRRRDKVKNVLASNDLYTIKFQGQKDYSIEKTLAALEGEYAAIFRNKIKPRLPLTEEEHVVLCAFVSVMLQRTLRHKNMLENFYDQLIERTESLEQQHGVPPKQSSDLRALKTDTHKLGVVDLLTDVTGLLMQMSVAFLCVDKSGRKFITSDDPCNLFNPDLQGQRFYGPGLGQKHVQLTLPLSPEIMLCLSWSDMRGYVALDKKWVDELNRLVRGHCYKYFVSHSPKRKRLWFSSVPYDPIFFLQVMWRRAKIQARHIILGIKYKWWAYGWKSKFKRHGRNK